MSEARFLLTVLSPAVMPSFIFTGHSVTESMKGGMLMKSKHGTYGKETAYCSFGNYHCHDNVRHKSTIAALCQRRLLKNSHTAA